MAGAQDDAKEKLTLREAVKDFGWLPLSLISIGGGMALIDIAERFVLEGLTLITPFQIVLDGYHRITNLLGAIVEPTAQAALDWINARCRWSLHLGTHWRPIFVLAMVVVLANWRFASRLWGWLEGTAFIASRGLAMLLVAIVVGLAPLTSSWWGQGLVAAIPAATLVAAWTISSVVESTTYAGANVTVLSWWSFARESRRSLLLGLVAFGLGAIIALVMRPTGSGILALTGVIAFEGARTVALGLSVADASIIRLGLAIVGGFIAAGLILLSNWVVTAIS